MPENIGELGDVLFDTVEDAGEKMAKIVRKYLIGIYICILAEFFFFFLYICSADRFASSGNENTTRFNILFSGIFQKFLLQCLYDEHTPAFTFAKNKCFAFLD